MREPLGPLGRIADSFSGSLRRRQRASDPRAIVFDAAGRPRLVPAGTPEHRDLIRVATELVELGTRPPEDGRDDPAGEGPRNGGGE